MTLPSTPIRELIRELRNDARQGNDIAAEDAARMFNWLDTYGGPEWQRLIASRTRRET